MSAVAGLAPWLPPGEPAAQLAGRPVLLAHGTSDTITSPAETWAFVERARAVTEVAAVEVRDGDHPMLRRARLWHALAAEFARAALGLPAGNRVLAAAVTATAGPPHRAVNAWLPGAPACPGPARSACRLNPSGPGCNREGDGSSSRSEEDDDSPSARLVGLHLVSRRMQASLLALAVAAVALRVVLRWTPASGAYAVMFPLIVATAAATAVSMTIHSPLGETERVTGRWLPWLRLGTVLVMAGGACGALALGAVGGHLAIGVPGPAPRPGRTDRDRAAHRRAAGRGPELDRSADLPDSQQLPGPAGVDHAVAVAGPAAHDRARPSAPSWVSWPASPRSPCAAPASGPDQGSSTTAAPCVPCRSRDRAAAASASG